MPSRLSIMVRQFVLSMENLYSIYFIHTRSINSWRSAVLGYHGVHLYRGSVYVLLVRS